MATTEVTPTQDVNMGVAVPCIGFGSFSSVTSDVSWCGWQLPGCLHRKKFTELYKFDLGTLLYANFILIFKKKSIHELSIFKNPKVIIDNSLWDAEPIRTPALGFCEVLSQSPSLEPARGASVPSLVLPELLPNQPSAGPPFPMQTQEAQEPAGNPTAHAEMHPAPGLCP